jgi:thiol-disulfide isomerase/thioredoxin
MKRIIFTLSLILGLALVGMVASSWQNYSVAKKSKSQLSKSMHYENKLSSLNVVDVDGKRHKGEDLKKGFLIVNFWASWCTPCMEEFPSLVALDKKITSENFKILTINSDDEKSKKKIRKVMKKFGMKFPVVSDETGKITDDFMISALPVSLIFHNGKLIEESQGAKDFVAEEFIEIIKEKIAL